LQYGYDPAGSTSVTNGTSVTRFVVNPNAVLPQVLIRTKSDNSKTLYVYGLGLFYEVNFSSGGAELNTRTYHYDYRGSTVAITDDNGMPTDRIEYSPYGMTAYRIGSTDTPFLYNGRYGVMTDSNGLLYMRARYYNPYLCRFLNPDPAGFAGGLNFYCYADGNPISLIDPFGLWAGVDDAIAIGGGALIGIAAQGIADLIHGQASSWQHYVAAAVGGAAAGEATLYTGPGGGLVARAAVGGAAGGLVGNTTRQTLDIATDNQTSYSYSSAVTETVFGGGFGAGGGYVGSRAVPAALSYLSNSTKGAIGEGLSLVDNVMQGRVPVGSQVEVQLHGTFTRVDWRFRSIADWSTLINVESKFGTARLTRAQRLANQLLPNYEVDHWTYSWLSRSGTALGTSFGYGAASESGTGK
jgi:RHS repeat-associated protein